MIKIKEVAMIKIKGVADPFFILSPFAKYPERKLADECEDVLLRRDSAPDEALGEDTPTVRS